MAFRPCVHLLPLFYIATTTLILFVLPIRLFRDPILVENIWYLWHPLLPIDAIELPLRRHFSWLIQRSGHDIAKMVLSPFSVLEDTAAAFRAEFTVQERARTIVCFMDNGLGGAILCIRERLHRNLRGEAEICAEEFLPAKISTI